MEKEQPQRLGIYIHIPFCVKKCGYCDFLSFPAEEAWKEHYVKALCQEIQAGVPDWSKHVDAFGGLKSEDELGIPQIVHAQARVSTIFFGGGTPSLLTGEQIGQVINQIRQEYPVAEDAEITMEANPGTLTAESLRAYRQAGINRLSIGLQSAQNEELRLLGRIHTWEEFFKNFRAARKASFENINIDLMSALPGQTLASWEDTLKKVLDLQPEHISAYSLILEEGTPFYQLYGGKGKGSPLLDSLLLPDEETERRMYEVTEEYCRQAGLYRYEISNYARPGYECRHNCSYWQRIPYLGFGLGASSFWGEVRWRNQTDMIKYLRCWMPEEVDTVKELRRIETIPIESNCEKEEAAGAWQEIEPLSPLDQMAETMFLGLRMMEGIGEAEFYQHFGQSMEQVYGKVLGKQEQLGLLERRDGRVRLTKYGIDVSNQVFWEYL